MSLLTLLQVDINLGVSIYVGKQKDERKTAAFREIVGDLIVISKLKASLKHSHEAFQSYHSMFDSVSRQFLLEYRGILDNATPSDRIADAVLESWANFEADQNMVKVATGVRRCDPSTTQVFFVLEKVVKCEPSSVAPKYQKEIADIRTDGALFFRQLEAFFPAVTEYQNRVTELSAPMKLSSARSDVIRYARGAAETCDRLLQSAELLNVATCEQLQMLAVDDPQSLLRF